MSVHAGSSIAGIDPANRLPERRRDRCLIAAFAIATAALVAACGGGSSTTATPSGQTGSSSGGSSSGGSSSGGSSSGSSSGGMGSVAVSPLRAALTTSQAATFAATVTGSVTSQAVTWDVDGIAGGNAQIGTISTAGVYTPPSAGGVHTIGATSVAAASAKGTATVAVTDLAGVFTYHNDGQRTGQNLQEYALTAAMVSNPATFGKLFSCTVDGAVYAQPLYVANLAIPNVGTRNVVFVATQADGVYAFDADGAKDPITGNCLAYWYQSFVAPMVPNVATLTPTDTGDLDDIPNQIGITGTPVVGNQTLYVVARTKDGAGGPYHHKLHALSLATGAELANSPAEITATASSTSGTITFNPLTQAQRPALLLAPNGTLYIALGSNGDVGLYFGWVLAYNPTTLVQTGSFITTPNGLQGAIWMTGNGPAVDSDGFLYFSTANGTFDATNAIPPAQPNVDFAESFLKLNGGTLQLQDFFTPQNQAALTTADTDFGSGGIIVLPDSVGTASHPHLAASVGKEGKIYLYDRSNLGKYTAGGPDGNLQTVAGAASTHGGPISGGFFSSPAYWNNTLYVAGEDDVMKAYPFTGGLLPANPTLQSAEMYQWPGATPSIAGSPGGPALVWVVDTGANGTPNNDSSGILGPAILRAYDASQLGAALFSSDALTANACGNAIKFVVPTVANGKVYVGGTTQLTVYGLIP